MLDEIAGQPGTYLLILHSQGQPRLEVGRLGKLRLQVGYYLYVGSAFGPGGVRARVRHHHAISRRPHWHLDYLRPHLSLQEVWYSTSPRRHEHEWAGYLYYTMQMTVPLARLGASDCRCKSHFFHAGEQLDRAGLRDVITDKNNTKLMTVNML